MATNSFRERLILADYAIVSEISGFTTVVRRMQSYSELKEFAVTQFPVAAVVGRLPIPKEYKSGRTSGEILQVRSELSVDVYVYLHVNVDMDTEISNYADTLWASMLGNPTRSKLCLSTIVKLEEDIVQLPPFGAFKLTCIHEYIHGIGGI